MVSTDKANPSIDRRNSRHLNKVTKVNVDDDISNRITDERATSLETNEAHSIKKAETIDVLTCSVNFIPFSLNAAGTAKSIYLHAEHPKPIQVIRFENAIEAIDHMAR